MRRIDRPMALIQGLIFLLTGSEDGHLLQSRLALLRAAQICIPLLLFLFLRPR